MAFNRAKVAPCFTWSFWQRTYKTKAGCQSHSRSISQPFEVPCL